MNGEKVLGISLNLATSCSGIASHPRAPWKKSFAERWHKSSSKMLRDVGNPNVISWFSHRKHKNLKACALCCWYIRMHPTFMQRTNMIERCKPQLTHLAVNRDSLSLRTLVFATWVHFTLRNADDLLLALSPQDESSLGLMAVWFDVFECVWWIILQKLDKDADFDAKELE